ncbi:MAG: hypothetical protein P8Y09_10900 [Deltaproteobacteria bacterium]
MCAVFIIIATVSISSCALLPGRVSGRTLISEKYGFTLEIPEGDFEAKYTKDIPLIFINPDTGATITVTVSDDKNGGVKSTDAALHYIAKGLFFYVKEKEYLESKKASLGDLDAWYLKLTGKYKGKPYIFSTYVVRHNKKIYDVTLFSSPGDFEGSCVLFMKIVNSFKFRGEGDK